MNLLLKPLGSSTDTGDYTKHIRLCGYELCEEAGTAGSMLYLSEKSDYTVFLWGELFEATDTPELMADTVFEEKGPEGIFELDGDFLYGRVCAGGSVVLTSSRDGQIPVFYKNNPDGIHIATDEELLFDDYAESDVDMHALNAYLRYGTVVGDLTMSRRVRFLESGSVLEYKNGETRVENIWTYVLKPDRNVTDEELRDEILESYKKAFLKRSICGGSDTIVLLSGGMDSRIILSCINEVMPEKVRTVCFGQTGCDEVSVARTVAALRGNPFESFDLSPEDFTRNAVEYISSVCCEDTFPESFILGTLDRYNAMQFADGYGIGSTLGDTYLPDILGEIKGNLSENIENILPGIKMQVLEDSTLNKLCRPEVYALLRDIGYNDIINAAGRYDDYDCLLSVQPFTKETRGKRQVYRRNKMAEKNMKYNFAPLDKDFLRAASRIPPHKKFHRGFQCSLFEKNISEYAAIPYNNTRLPLNAPYEFWKEGIKTEYAMELLYEKIMADHNRNLGESEKIYYRHYYSDFNGYSRYSSAWKALFDRYLLNKDSYICSRWFDYNSLVEMYEEHLSGKANHRPKLLLLTSMEMFFGNKL